MCPRDIRPGEQVSGLMVGSTREWRREVKPQYIHGLGNKLGIKDMREGSMSEVMAQTGEGNTPNISGSDTKFWLVPREVLDHCSRKVCDAWKTHQ